MSSDKERHYSANIRLFVGSAAPVRGSINVSNNKPRACALGYAGVSPLQGFSTSSHMLYYFDEVALTNTPEKGYIKLIFPIFVPDKVYNKMEARTIIAQYVKEMRKKYKLTQIDLSEKAGVGLRFVRELEQGKTTLRLDKVNKVFELFGSECGPVPMRREGDDV